MFKYSANVFSTTIFRIFTIESVISRSDFKDFKGLKALRALRLLRALKALKASPIKLSNSKMIKLNHVEELAVVEVSTAIAEESDEHLLAFLHLGRKTVEREVLARTILFLHWF